MKIVWTESAELSFSDEIEFIGKKWTGSEVVNFIDLVDTFVKKLEIGIIEGKISKSTNIRSFVISKQTTLFFEIIKERNTVILLLFWNNKRNPKELKNRIEKF
jgi:hypothetical protein